MKCPTSWPDGSKLGGENGYSPEWHEWARECEVKFVARQMLAVPKEQRKAVFDQWAKVFTHITQEKVKSVWDQVVDEIKRNAKGNKTQQLRNNATKTQR
ncbi:hypothetical protein QT231_02765 [Halomonas sp. SpR1]|uniref:hypothetical protein n=1 Tax=Halomonas sp. SpR1 TaxID=3050462 RepID=UPI0027E53F48|nr:hypothetical protein [Halomonas sp. SpR1]MDQ7731603.1 hypothetical protein [Halomonas sp. SpR1]